MTIDAKYLDYISGVRRYSARTAEIYRDVLRDFASWGEIGSDEDWICMLVPQTIRAYEVFLMDTHGDGASTVTLHLSVLSGLCRYLVKEGVLESNPVRLVPRPRQPRRLPVVYREESLRRYLDGTAWIVEEDFGPDAGMYARRLRRLIVSMLYQTGIRRSELIGLDRGSLDLSRHTLRVHGKGDKIRVIPLTAVLCDELQRYMDSAEAVLGPEWDSASPLLRTPKGKRLYPVFVDRSVKAELGVGTDITVRRSPHVLRHTLATALLDEGADLNAIKEMLGHSSLAATQVYTHNSIEKLRKAYDAAHPRAAKTEE